MARGGTWFLAVLVSLGALLPGCRLSRDDDALPSQQPPAAPSESAALPALVRPPFSPLLDADAAVGREPLDAPRIPDALQRIADADAPVPTTDEAPGAAASAPPILPQPVLPQPVLPQPVPPPPAATPADAPAPGQLAVVATGFAVAPEVLQKSAEQACRALAAGTPIWDALDQSLRTLACALRASGRAPREALVMGSDGRAGAAGALPFDLNPASVAAKVRDAALGSVVAEGARAFAGVEASWDCATPRAETPASTAPNEAGHVALMLRDESGAIAGGLVSAPERARPEGFLSASVTPGDYLYVGKTAAALLLGPDMRLRAQGRAQQLQARALAGFTQPAPDDPLFSHAQQAVWLDASHVRTLDPRVARIEWRREAVPAACQAVAP